jgi:hypothetical protein
MSDARDPQSLIDAAEQAATNGDYTTAERLLRQAAVLQEASLGPLHPDLAHTLNNLAVVCEIVDNPIDAEHYFRRACAIATAVLEPDHPFVATSRKNLEDFCAARGKAVKLPAAVSLATDRGGIFPTGAASDPVPEPRPAEQRPAGQGSRWNRPRVAAVVGVCLVVAFALAAWLRSREPTKPTGPLVSSRELRPTPDPPSGHASPSPAEIERADSSARPAEPPGPVASTTGYPEAADTTAPRSVSPPPAVVVAQLCGTLSTGGPGGWRCDPATDSVNPGRIYFYTRLKSPAAVTVQHRWYRGNRLRRVVPLVIRANTSEGYRTFSRQTVAAEGSGEWKVELTTVDGAVLHEERFVVR